MKSYFVNCTLHIAHKKIVKRELAAYWSSIFAIGMSNIVCWVFIFVKFDIYCLYKSNALCNLEVPTKK